MTHLPSHLERCDLHDLAADGPQPWNPVLLPLLRAGWIAREGDKAVITTAGRNALQRARDSPVKARRPDCRNCS